MRYLTKKQLHSVMLHAIYFCREVKIWECLNQSFDTNRDAIVYIVDAILNDARDETLHQKIIVCQGEGRTSFHVFYQRGLRRTFSFGEHIKQTVLSQSYIDKGNWIYNLMESEGNPQIYTIIDLSKSC